METLDTRKLPSIKASREIKRWKDVNKPNVEPIVLSYVSIVNPIAKKPSYRALVQQSHVMKRNAIYFSDEVYQPVEVRGSLNCQQRKGDNESMIKAMSSDKKKKRMSRSDKKGLSSLCRLQNKVIVLQQSAAFKISRYSRTERYEKEGETCPVESNVELTTIEPQSQTVIMENKLQKMEMERERQKERKIQMEMEMEKEREREREQQRENQKKKEKVEQKEGQLKEKEEIDTIKERKKELLSERQKTLDNNPEIHETKEEKKQQIIVTPIQLPSGLQSIRNFFYSPVGPSKRHTCLLKCVKFSLKPRFLLFSNQLKLLMSAESQIGSIGAHYYFFIGQPKQKQDREYMGKLRGILFETFMSLYSRGSSSTSTENLGMRRELIANIMFNQQQEQRVIIPKPTTSKSILKENWNHLQQLEQTYRNSTIRMKIKETKGVPALEPSSSQTTNKRARRLSLQSTQSRVIIQNQMYKESLTVRKIYDNLYEISVAEPFSIYQAFGIVIAKCKGKLESL